MEPKRSRARILLAVGAAAGMLTFLVMIGGSLWPLIVLLFAEGGSGGVMLGIGVVPLGLGVAGLVAFLLCARSLRRGRQTDDPDSLR
jgi:hypothetical protein